MSYQTGAVTAILGVGVIGETVRDCKMKPSVLPRMVRCRVCAENERIWYDFALGRTSAYPGYVWYSSSAFD